jgi:hypothetical protein
MTASKRLVLIFASSQANMFFSAWELGRKGLSEVSERFFRPIRGLI